MESLAEEDEWSWNCVDFQRLDCSKVYEALDKLANDPELLRRKRERYNRTPPYYSSGDTTPYCDEEPEEGPQVIRVVTPKISTMPRQQFLAQARTERDRIVQQIHEVCNGLRSEETMPFDRKLPDHINAQNNVRNRWIRQGIWNHDWGRFPGSRKTDDGPWPYAGWGYEKKPSKTHRRRGAATLQSDANEMIDEESEAVPKPDTPASRPYYQFLYQVSEEIQWLEVQLHTESPDTESMKTSAYENVKREWTDQEIWNPKWGELPGMTWMHEDEVDGQPEAAVTPAATSAPAEATSASCGSVQEHTSPHSQALVAPRAEAAVGSQAKTVASMLAAPVGNDVRSLGSPERERAAATSELQRTRITSNSRNLAEISAVSGSHISSALSAEARMSIQIPAGTKTKRRGKVASLSPTLSPAKSQEASVLCKVRSARFEKPVKPQVRATRAGRGRDLHTLPEKPRRSTRLAELRNNPEPVTTSGVTSSRPRDNQKRSGGKPKVLKQPKLARESSTNAKPGTMNKVTVGRVAKKSRAARKGSEGQLKSESDGTGVDRVLVVPARRGAPRTRHATRPESKDVAPVSTSTSRAPKALARSRRR